MKKITLFLLSSLLAFVSCGKSLEKEFQEIEKAMPKIACEKMITCMKPMLDKLPAEAKQHMPPMMSSVESCEKEIAAQQAKRNDAVKGKLNKEIVDSAKKCMEDFKSLKCETIESSIKGGGGDPNPESCKKLDSLMK